MLNNNYENSPLRWVVSFCIAAAIILIALVLMVRESRKPPLNESPLMELDYVVVQSEISKKEKNKSEITVSREFARSLGLFANIYFNDSLQQKKNYGKR